MLTEEEKKLIVKAVNKFHRNELSLSRRKYKKYLKERKTNEKKG